MKYKYFGLLILLSIFKFQVATAQNNERPNIIFILADDLGYGDLGVYGQKLIKTPVLDSLANNGILLKNFYAGTSVCAPSRASLLSGQHTGHTYIRGNKEIEPEGQEPLADSVTTIAMLLKNAGYQTGAFGKWGLGMVGTSGDPNTKGFDEFFGYNCQRQSHTYYPNHLWHNNKIIEFKNNQTKRNVYAPDLIQQKTLAFIDKNKETPFFLYVPTILPHAELSGPIDSIYQQYENAFEEVPYIGNHYISADKPRAMYASMVTRMDTYVGQIVNKLKELNLSDNTIIIFSSDNGAHQEGGADPNFFNSSGDLKGLKRSLYEGGIRTSFIAYWPEKIKPQVINNQKLAFWDIMPTVVNLANAKQTSYTDGISFKQLLLGKKINTKKRALYWEFHEEGGRQALIKGDWKLIVQQVKNKEKTYFELFNLSVDPSEQKNLASDNPKLVNKLYKEIQKQHVESSLFPLIKP